MKPSFHRYTTGNPFTRRCVKCGQVNYINAFRVPITEAQAAVLDYGGKDIPGIDLETGQYLRGYYRPLKKQKRLVLGPLCPTCRSAPAPRRKGSPTFQAIMRQIAKKRASMHALIWFTKHKTSMSQEQKDKRVDYATKALLLLDRAAYLARDRRDRGIQCPAFWDTLLTKKEREELSTLHGIVAWQQIEPDVF